MNRLVLLLLLTCISPRLLQAQRYAPFTVKADLSMPFRKGVGAALEWQFAPNSALAVQFAWEQHAKASEFGLFNGDLLVNFVELQVDTVRKGDFAEHSVNFYYVGDGRPLPILPEIIALSTTGIKLGHRFSFGKTNSKWRWSMQPSLSIIGHKYYDVKQVYLLLGESVQLFQEEMYPIIKWTATHKYRIYNQEQRMRERLKWLPGLAYDFGLSRRFGQRLTVEARVSGLYNLETPYEAPQPAPVQGLQARAHLYVGYALGKMR